MPTFQTRSIPHGFTADDTGKVIHYKDAIVVPVPPPNGGLGWKRLWFSLGYDFGDGRIRVAVFMNGSWSAKNYDVLGAGPRVGFEVTDGTEKISLGRVMRTASDRVDNNPVGWLLEAQWSCVPHRPRRVPERRRDPAPAVMPRNPFAERPEADRRYGPDRTPPDRA
ncbi:hypothetical protein AB0E67_32155 [Streptomyces sp. NPDC032161]|uniref:hypothetical protein n=1 Tax=unclassified Streptomyces TaxID=2593676 RepID=UPI00340C8C33